MLKIQAGDFGPFKYLFYCLLAVMFLLLAFPRFKYPELDHGDEWADADIMNSSGNFLRYGFIKCRFLPYFTVQPDIAKDKPYGHYPSLGVVFTGFLRRIFSTDSLHFLRGISLFFSALNLFLWFIFIRRFTKSYPLAFLAGLFYLTNPFFIYGMDSLGQILFADVIKNAIFISFLAMLDAAGSQRIKLTALIWVLLVIESMMTLEYIAYLGLFFVLYKLIFMRRSQLFTWKDIVIFAPALVLGLFILLLQNIWSFGGASGAIADLKRIALERIGKSSDSPIPLNLLTWLQYVGLRNISLTMIFEYAVLVPFGVVSFFMYKSLSPLAKAKVKPLFLLWCIFLACGFTWYVFFPAHSLAHTFVLYIVHHLLPMAAVAFTLVFYTMHLYISEHRPNSLVSRVPLAGLIFIVVISGIFNSSLPVRKEVAERGEYFLVFKESLLRLRDMSKNEKDIIGINYYRNPPVSYYTKRNCKAVFTKEALEALPQRPKFFIFIANNRPESQELMKYLFERYNVLFYCDSPTFPSVFMELKG